MKKLENHWFKHDINASNDAKIQKLEFKHGLIGYAMFFKIVEVLMQNNGQVENDLDMLAYQLKIDDLEVLRAVLNDFGLFVVDDAIITSERVLNQLSEITEKSKKASTNAKKKHSIDYEKILAKIGRKYFSKEDADGFYSVFFERGKLKGKVDDSPIFHNLEQAEEWRYKKMQEVIKQEKEKGEL